MDSAGEVGEFVVADVIHKREEGGVEVEFDIGGELMI